MTKDEKNEISKEEIEKLQEIIDGLKCSKNLQCCQTGFEKVCKARLIGDKGLLECLDDIPSDCMFAESYHDQFFICQCPLRKYIAEKFEKK
jgi:hypothetical protein